ncbi:MAG TPA: adenylate/guanylate cyclase domain-containing protein, partial [Marmoricola sp.]|nr:adenylate/guanylate cyclase domain-containing protein [Marmoricola sp.]
AGARLAFAGPEELDRPMMVAGFADIVGYTARSRSMRGEELAALVDAFDARSLEIVAEHGGQVIKTIGDEILYVADTPIQGALIALELVNLATIHEGFPELRVGLAYGPVLARLGDVYGPVVNLASRLTSVAKPGRVVVDRVLAEELVDDAEFRVRRMRRTTLKGFGIVEPWSLKRPRVVENRSGD